MSSNTVLRRYTPPTCTLEIVSQTLPLFRWVRLTANRATSLKALKHLNFSLNFDDPRLPEEQRITIHGNKAQLEALCQEVKAYIHDFLVQKPENFPGWHSVFSTQQETPTTIQQAPTSPIIDQSEIDQLKPEEKEIINISPQQNFSSELPETEQAYPNPPTQENYQNTASPDTTKLPDHNLNLSPANNRIYLKPSNLLSHDLFLGSLATQESGPAINLSLLQLFDLATALEEYKAEQKGLPNSSPTSGRKLPPYWAISAAMVAVTVGLTAGIVKMLDQGKRTPGAAPAVINPSTDPNQVNPSAVQPQIAVVPSPLPAATPGVVTPPGTSPQIPSPTGLASNQTPNPTATPLLGNNTPGAPAQIPPMGITPNTPSSQINVPATPPGGLPPGTYRIGSTPPGTPGVPPNSGAISGTTINIPVNSGTTPANRKKTPVSPASIAQVRPETRSTQNITRPSQTPVQMFARETSPPPSPPLLNFPTIQPTATPSISPFLQNTQPPVKPTPAATPKPKESSQLASLGHQLGTSTAEPLFSNTLRQQSGQTAETVNNTSGNGNTETSAAPTTAALTTDTPPKGSPSGNASNSNSLFDQIPQVAEARQFFQQRWQPPSSLTQDQIEYTLAVNADGTIKQVTPRGQVAQIYLDRTQMPLVGEPFVSPIDGGRNPEILLILHKNGKVETRLQTLN